MTGAFLWFAATAGAVSLLTPCVFPMVPITVSWFLRDGGGRRAALRGALLFALGIVVTFTGLGLALAVLVGATGINRLAADPWMNLALAAVFVAFALALLGVVQPRVPSALLGRVDAAVRRSPAAGAAGSLLMGLLFTLTSFTCTAPFVGTLLVTAAQGSWRWPLVGMLVYSTVFALPFFVLALVPRWMTRLPRSGEWLVSLKGAMGLLEIAASAKFLSNADLVWRWGIFTRDIVLLMWVVVAVAIAFQLVGAVTFVRGAARETPGLLRASLALAFLALAVWLAAGIRGLRLGELESFLPPAAERGSPRGVTLAWRLNDLQGSIAAARASRQRVFIDFTGYTCTNCRWMEANMFTRPEIIAALSRFQLARLFTDGDGPMYEAQQALQEKQFGTVALPLYAIVDADGKTVATFPGLTRDPAEFLAFLDKGAR